MSRIQTRVVGGALLICAIHAWPILAAYLRQGRLLKVAYAEEVLYGIRVQDVARGGSLGNPYLAEHQDAPGLLPEMAERVLGITARVTGASPAAILGVSRVLFAGVIFLLVESLARNLGLDPHLALVAGLLPPLLPSVTQVFAEPSDAPSFLRYFRAISPGPSVALFLAAIRALLAARDTPPVRVWTRGILAGVMLGTLFYNLIFYSSVAIAGAVILAFLSAGAARRAFLIALLVAALLAIPYALHMLTLFDQPEFQETLLRNGLMAPGSAPSRGAVERFLLGLLFAVPLWVQRHKLPAASFLLSFLAPGAFFFLQNIATNRAIAENHWVDPLIPLWCLALVAALAARIAPVRPAGLYVLGAGLLGLALYIQQAAYLRWERIAEREPDLYALDTRIPQTLGWLNRETPAGSVILSSDAMMTSLALHTHNKVYWSFYAGIHLVSEREAIARQAATDPWPPRFDRPLAYRADYFLGADGYCPAAPARRELYRNAVERTCVLALR